MNELTEQEIVRREKLQDLTDKGIKPFGYPFERTHLSNEIFDLQIFGGISLYFSKLFDYFNKDSEIDFDLPNVTLKYPFIFGYI